MNVEGSEVDTAEKLCRDVRRVAQSFLALQHQAAAVRLSSNRDLS